jgi:hypothetical protein
VAAVGTKIQPADAEPGLLSPHFATIGALLVIGRRHDLKLTHAGL